MSSRTSLAPLFAVLMVAASTLPFAGSLFLSATSNAFVPFFAVAAAASFTKKEVVPQEDEITGDHGSWGVIGDDAARNRSRRNLEPHVDERPIGIVIMAQGRSGSTMLGETFRQNKDVLYWYEPCRGWGQGLFSSSSEYHREYGGADCAGLVRRLARCEFSLQDSARLGVDPAALDSGSAGLAPLRKASDNPSADALAQAHEAVIDTCKKSRAVVVKTIRADRGIGKEVTTLDDGGDYDPLHVVHLVRDPRAVIHSQVKTFNVAHKYRRYFQGAPPPPAQANEASALDFQAGTPGSQKPASKNTTRAVIGASLPRGGLERARTLGFIICGVYRDQLETSAKVGDIRYLRVRYEDIASAPDATVKRVYEWSGLGAVPARVSLWIQENTRLSDCEDRAAPSVSKNGGGGGGGGAVLEEARRAEEQTFKDIDANTNIHVSGDGNVGGNEDVYEANANAATATASTASLPLLPPLPLAAGTTMEGRNGAEAVATGDGTISAEGAAEEAGATVLASTAARSLRKGKERRRTAVAVNDSSTDRQEQDHKGLISQRQQQERPHRSGCEELTARTAEWDRYGTRRHASAMADLWRTQMAGDEALAVWEACSDSGVLEEMGYAQ